MQAAAQRTDFGRYARCIEVSKRIRSQMQRNHVE